MDCVGLVLLAKSTHAALAFAVASFSLSRVHCLRLALLRRPPMSATGAKRKTCAHSEPYRFLNAFLPRDSEHFRIVPRTGTGFGGSEVIIEDVGGAGRHNRGLPSGGPRPGVARDPPSNPTKPKCGLNLPAMPFGRNSRAPHQRNQQ